MPKRDGKWYCDYHPHIESRTVKKNKAVYITCDECEWNPPDAGDDADGGRTVVPNVKTLGVDFE